MNVQIHELGLMAEEGVQQVYCGIEPSQKGCHILAKLPASSKRQQAAHVSVLSGSYTLSLADAWLNSGNGPSLYHV